MDKLKPCPFCGGEAVLRHESFCGYDSQLVECTNRKKCGAKVEPVTDVPEVAIKAWNTRAERTCKRVATAAKIPIDPYGLNLKTRHICSECSTEILPWFRYCEFCGAKVEV